MPKAKPEKKSISQHTRFIKAAREAECSEDEAVFDANLKRIAKAKAEPAKKRPLKADE